MSNLFLATMPSSRLAVAVAAVLIPFSSAAIAADPQISPTTLDRVEVRGVRPGIATVDSIDQAAERLGQRAGGTALVDGERYRDGRVSTLADALGYAPGVFIQPRFGAEEARLSVRGSGLQRTFHGRGIELLQDGSPLNLADGGFDFQAVEPLSARYIEVYRGANALEYGAATLGGAINFVSPTGYDASPMTARIEAGSFGYLRGQISAAGHGDRADGYVSLTGLNQDGYRDHAQQENYRLFGNAGFRFSDSVDGRLYVTHVDTRSQLPGNLTLAQSNARPETAAAGNLALDQRRDFRLDRVAGKLVWSPAQGQTLIVSAYYADKALHHPIFQVLQQDTQDAGVDLRWRSEGRIGERRNVLVAGIAFAQGSTDDNRFANVAGRAGARTNKFDQRATNAKAYLENQTWLSEHWTLVAGAQALKSTRRSRDLFVTGGRDESFDAEYGGFSPKLGMRYLIDDGTQLFANVSRSLEPPSFGELTGGPGVTQVDMQRATTAEVGTRIERGALSVDAALYRARIDGELLALSDGAGNPLGTINADRTLHQGLELGLGWRIADAWLLSANYLWNDFRFDGDAVYGDKELAGMPQQQLRSELRWSASESLYIAPTVEWAPQDYYVDHANTFKAPGYAIAGLRIGGRFASQWSWFVDARNLADRKWIASTNVVADARGRDGANFLPGDGRSFYVGLEWRQ
ncbi:TonB-dependent receptor [Luteimonas sp. SX5]|uniref:TonB-dependent receptor n=1 Tax=Luteimonas galliterrae TaxID=2940486 RepID=A0ABT0MJM4_9GAMM|nr:TonB-dependent receptor [Luteimonas galliterrae]MCL1635070.1 TonB-dependent receptor [Luteimonas galliterrae]